MISQSLHRCGSQNLRPKAQGPWETKADATFFLSFLSPMSKKFVTRLANSSLDSLDSGPSCELYTVDCSTLIFSAHYRYDPFRFRFSSSNSSFLSSSGALLAPNFPTSSPLGSVRDFTALTSDLRPPTSVTSLFASGLRPPSSDLRPPTSQFQTARDPEFNKYSVSDNHPEI
ncbi:uncharacterized protein LOC144563547 isoform X1 [Carex rostrata]